MTRYWYIRTPPEIARYCYSSVGHRASNGGLWWSMDRRSTSGITWNDGDLETRCADLLAWQRKQRMQRQQRTAERNLYRAKPSPRQPHADGLSEVSRKML